MKSIQGTSGLIEGRVLPCPVHSGDLPQIRQFPEWEHLRHQIVDKAIYFTDQLVFDFRRMLTQSGNTAMAGRLMWQLIKRYQPQVLIGPGFGASPLLYSTALAALADGVELQLLMVRDKRKAHNQKRWVEGDHASAAGKRAVMLDDFMKAGSALPLVREALKADSVKLDIVALALFFDMWEPLGSRQISTSQLPVLSLFTRHDIGLSRDCHDAVPPLMKGSAPDFVGDTPRWWRMGLNKSMAYPTKCVPVIADGSVFVADEKSTLWKHDLATGDIRWSVPSLETPQKGIVQKLQHVQGSLVYGCYDGTLTRVDAETGIVQWRWKIDSSIHATPAIDEAGDGVRDMPSCIATYFSFHQLPELNEELLRATFKVLMPLMHHTFARVVHLQQEREASLSCNYTGLTAREQEIVTLVIQGKSNFEIASLLGTSEFTVRNQISLILKKTGCSNRTTLATAAAAQAQERFGDGTKIL